MTRGGTARDYLEHARAVLAMLEEAHRAAYANAFDKQSVYTEAPSCDRIVVRSLAAKVDASDAEFLTKLGEATRALKSAITYTKRIVDTTDGPAL